MSLPCLSHTSCSSGTRSRKQMYYKVAKLTWKLLTTLRILKPPGHTARILPRPPGPENQLGWLWEECTRFLKLEGELCSRGSVCTPSLRGAQRGGAPACYVMRARIGQAGPPSPASLSAGLDSLDADIHMQFQTQFLSPFCEAFLISPVSIHHFPLYDTR